MTKQGMINIAGASEGRIAPIIANLRKDKKGQSLIVVSTLNRAKRLASDLSFFSGENIYILPPEEESLIQFEARSNDDLLKRMSVLRAVSRGEDCIVIAPVTGAIKKLPPKEIFAENVIEITRGEDIDLDKIREKLTLQGYERVSMVEGRGEYSVRGGILDVFTPDSDNPYRIELFDTEVDSIRTFDLNTQRSEEHLKSVSIYPCSQIPREHQLFAEAEKNIRAAYEKQIRKLEKKEPGTELIHQLKQREGQLLEYAGSMINIQYLEKFLHYFYEKTMYIWDYMRDPEVFIDDPARILETLEVWDKERGEDIETILSSGRGIGEDFKGLSGEKDYFLLYEKPGYIFTPFTGTIKNAPFLKELISVNCRQTPAFNGRMDLLKSELDSYVRRNFDVTIVCSSQEREKNLREFLIREKLDGRIAMKQGTLTAGMEFTDEKKVWIWEGDIFGGNRKSRRKRRKTRGEQIKSFADVQAGDYVVHEKYGIGIYRGLEKIEVDGALKDYLVIEYAEGGKLYVLASETDRIQKYRSKESRAPKINRLGGSEWQKVRNKVKGHVSEVAQHLVKLYSERQAREGFAYSPDSEWQKEFEETFPYTETDDQLKAIEDVKADMESHKIMDRLVCGDVGFGKTEVAIRAAFKAVGDSKQVAYLVPTTILAEQHYETFTERMKDYPVTVRLLCRFCTQKEIKSTLRELKEGKVDIVIGTHRLLSKDVEFKNLGLLIIDEEQRFGVNHKEKIKEMKTNVDVLTLTATPIPRTLHMSLVGIRDMSLLEEPPVDRRPIQTYVMEYDRELAREAIARELARHGQVYYVYNRVEGIERFADDVRSLVPYANVEFAHGQMDGRTLEDIMYRFNKKEIDVLVCTTIIETGLDIPNANTIIIHDANLFGLAQLYQLRGRVGRSDRSAFAFMFYRRNKMISEVAEKRLRAIKEYTDLGSGVKVSKADLNIRGAGSVLGESQSGNYEVVGYDLYCKMLNDAVRELRGEKVFHEYETEIDLPVDSFIPETYVKNDFVKLELCKRISLIKNEDEYNDIVDELIDRFGDIPDETMNLLDVALLRANANICFITRIWYKDGDLRFVMYNRADINVDGIDELVKSYSGRMKFVMGAKPEFILKLGREEKNDLLRKAEFVVADMSQMLIMTHSEEDSVDNKA